jgi:glycolate oxidase
MLASSFINSIRAIVGPNNVRDDAASLDEYGTDALKRGHPAELVVLPGTTGEVSAIAQLCNAARVPLVPRGAGTGYTGGAVPLRGGVVLSLERFNRILEIDEGNLLAVVQPAVINGQLQAAVERIGRWTSRALAAMSPNAPAGRARSSMGRRSGTCSAWKPCCRRARSCGRAGRRSRTSSATT